MPLNSLYQSGESQETREQTPLQRSLQQYRETYQRLYEKERTKTGDSLRSALDDFRTKNNLPALNSVQQQDDALLRQLTVFTNAELTPIREQIVAELMKKISDRPGEADEVLSDLFSTLQEAQSPDLLLIDELLRKTLETAVKNRIDGIKAKTPTEIRDGFNAIDDPTPENLRKIGAAPTAQEVAFDLYLLQLWSLRQHPQALQEIIKPENKTLDAFVRITFPSYQSFMREQGLGSDLYGPNEAWYAKLARKAGVEQQLRTLQVPNYPAVTAFNGRMLEQAAELDMAAKKLPDGSPDRLALENQAKGLRDLQRRLEQATPLIPGASQLKIEGGAFGWISNQMDKVATYIPTPGTIRDMQVSDIWPAAAKLMLGATALLNLAGPIMAEVNVTGNFLRKLIIERKPSEAIKMLPDFINPIRNNLMAVAVTTPAALYFATRGLRDVDATLQAGWSKLSETFGEIGAWMKTTSEPYLNRGPEGFKAYVSDHAEAFYADLRGGDGKRWEAAKSWPGMTPEKIEAYRKHFQTMVDLEREMKTSFTSLDVNRAVQPSLPEFNRFLGRFIQGNEDPKNPQRKDIPVGEFTLMAYLTREQASALPTNQPSFKPSEALARAFIEQGKWLKNTPNSF
ncbi:MAG: hypothetical protein AB7J40_02205 [Candidatus Altimarinota bacterium]